MLRIVTALTVFMALLAPAAYAQSSDNGYTDPFANQGSHKHSGGSGSRGGSGSGGSTTSGGGTSSGSVSGSSGAGGTAGTTTSGSSTSSDPGSASGNGSLPRTGFDDGLLAGAGAGIVLSGMALRRLARRDG